MDQMPDIGLWDRHTQWRSKMVPKKEMGTNKFNRCFSPVFISFSLISMEFPKHIFATTFNLKTNSQWKINCFMAATLLYSLLTVRWETKAQCFCPPYFKTWFFYVVFNAEFNGTIRILSFCLAIIDLLWPSRVKLVKLGHSMSINSIQH